MPVNYFPEIKLYLPDPDTLEKLDFPMSWL